MLKRMNPYDFDELRGIDFADDMLRAIEKDYGRSIVKIPKFERTNTNTFLISIIFTDYRLLEAEIKIVEWFDMPTLKVDGVYY
jgi:hypothetical protein